MGSQVSSITCVALTQQQSHFLKCLSSQELLGKSLKHGTSLALNQSRARQSGQQERPKGRAYTSTATPLGSSHGPTNSRATHQHLPPLASSPLATTCTPWAGLNSAGAANRAHPSSDVRSHPSPADLASFPASRPATLTFQPLITSKVLPLVSR